MPSSTPSIADVLNRGLPSHETLAKVYPHLFPHTPPPRATYPLVLLPKGFNIKDFYSPLQNEPRAPIEPTLTTYGNEFYFDFEEKIKAIFYFLSSILATFGWIGSGDIGIGLIAIPLYAMAILKIYIPFSRYEHKQNLNKINEDKYISQKEIYDKLLRQYEDDIKTYRLPSEKVRRDGLIRMEMKQKARTMLANTELTYYTGPLEGQMIGASEARLFDALCSEFPGQIHRDRFLTAHGDGTYRHRPDMVYHNKDTQLVIAIEVDEPYVHGTLKPIHYVGEDSQRNEQFLRKGWLIVRFTEQQVVKHTQECVNFIRRLSHDLCVSEQLIDLAQCEKLYFPQDARELCWTYDEALEMAYSGHRSSYMQ